MTALEFKELFPALTFINYEIIKWVPYITCSDKYGICIVRKFNLLKSKKLNILSAINPTEYWINQAREVHGNLYDYSLVEYKNSKTKVKIICKKHKDFEQMPSSHLNKNGCDKCGRISTIKGLKKYDVNSFIEKAKFLNNNFTYEKTIYLNPKFKVIVTCPIHGDKEVYPFSILKNHGCKQCKGSKKRKYTSKELLDICNKKHNFKYDYSLTDFTANLETEKVKIICSIHSIFEQTLISHKKISGCPFCADDNKKISASENPSGWTLTNWKKSGLTSKNFDSFKCYIIRCWNEEEEFYKIGRTFRTIKKRFKDKKSMPYNYEIIQEIVGEAEYIFNLENELKRKHKEFKYIPNIKFKGMQECFFKIII